MAAAGSHFAKATRSLMMKGAGSMMAVTVTLNKVRHDTRPAHHLNDTESLFENPWPSWDKTFKQMSLGTFYNMRKDWVDRPLPPKDELPPVVKPEWALENGLTVHDASWSKDIKSTWLGHACFLVEFPKKPEEERGYRILFDPVFSHRCSPSQLIGPARYTPPPMAMEEIPEIDACVISHAHYDHLDTATIKHLYGAQKKGSLHFFAPLGNKKWFKSVGVDGAHCSDMDWWDSAELRLSNSSVPTRKEDAVEGEVGRDTVLRLTCTPSQHFANRGLFDRNHTLWSSWAVEQVASDTGETRTKVWFGGDTGYKSVPRGFPQEEEYKLPHCPEFEKIGAHFGGFDLAHVPIGAWSPRWFMSRIHACPSDSVEIHCEIKSRKSVGMHWGCWVLTDEPVWEPKESLALAAAKKGLKEDEFITLGAIGSTIRITPRSPQ